LKVNRFTIIPGDFLRRFPVHHVEKKLIKTRTIEVPGKREGFNYVALNVNRSGQYSILFERKPANSTGIKIEQTGSRQAGSIADFNCPWLSMRYLTTD
jgi:hypothetical protein